MCKTLQSQVPLAEVASDQRCEDQRKLARAALSPIIQAATTLRDYERDLGDLDLLALVEKLHEQVEFVQAGDLDRVHEMLLAQAHTLDRLFNTLLQDAARTRRASQLDLFLKLGLRSQNQCRATLEALTALKGSRAVTFVGQNNFAKNQQINNEVVRVRDPVSGESAGENLQSKLMEKGDERWLDTGATSPTGTANSAMETVAEINRAKVG